MHELLQCISAQPHIQSQPGASSWQVPDPSCQLAAARVGMSSRPSTLAFKWKAICLVLANNSVSGLIPSRVLRPTQSTDQSIKQPMLCLYTL